MVSHTKKKRKDGWIPPPCQRKPILLRAAQLNHKKSQKDSVSKDQSTLKVDSVGKTDRAPFVPLKYVALDIEKVGLQTPLVNDCLLSAIKVAIVDEKGDDLHSQGES